jgi:hypothetical protein
MRKIEGHVIIIGTERMEFLLGKPGPDFHNYQNIESNGLTPFETIKKARYVARTIFSNLKFSKTSLGELYMKIAEIKDELIFFRKKTNLIVIMKDYDHISKIDQLFGPLLDEKTRSAYPIPGAWLGNNGYQPYKRKKEINPNPFERAMYQLSEINRQSDCAATIAQFRLKRLEEIF